VIAGASEGIGRAFGQSLAERELHLVLITRTEEPLAVLSEELKEEYHIETLPLSPDLSASGAVERIGAVTADLDVGLMVYNAALAGTGPFLDRQPEMLRRLDATNCAGPLLLCRHFGKKWWSGGKGD